MPDYAALIERLEKLEGPVLDGFERGRLAKLAPDLICDLDSENLFNLILKGELPAIGAAVALVERVLPGWGWRVATCCVSDDAWVFPDFNCPVHGERLKREFREDIDWVELTDVDLRPSGRPAIALVIATLKALSSSETSS